MSRRGVEFEDEDGVKHTVRLNLNAMISLEERTGRSMQDAFSKLDMKTIRDLVWAGLLHENKDLTPEQAGNFVDLVDFATIFKGLRERMDLMTGGNSARPTNAGEAQQPATENPVQGALTGPN